MADIGSLSGGRGCGDCPWESREDAGSCFGGGDSRAGGGVREREVWGVQPYASDRDVTGAGGGEDQSAVGAADFVGGRDPESEDKAAFEASAAAGEVSAGGDAFAGGWESS